MYSMINKEFVKIITILNEIDFFGTEKMDYKIKKNRLILKLKVLPGANKNYIDLVKNNELIIKIKAVPEKGKANKELINFLSKLLKIAKSEVNIVAGKTSRHKLISLPETTVIFLKNYLTGN